MTIALLAKLEVQEIEAMSRVRLLAILRMAREQMRLRLPEEALTKQSTEALRMVLLSVKLLYVLRQCDARSENSRAGAATA